MSDKSIILTVDVEDWFQVENFKDVIASKNWDSFERRYEYSTQKLLTIFDEMNATATFFMLGWNAKRSPQLVRDIVAAGHELASHGYQHTLNTQLNDDQLYDDLKSSKHLLEDIGGVQVKGYRAPSFSVTDATVSTLKKLGYVYDASLNGSNLNKRHGRINLNNSRKKGIAYIDSDGFFELPTSNLKMGNTEIPWSGGGYFRLIPSWIYHAGIRHILKTQEAYVFYTHPWEYDVDQPRVKHAKISAKFRHYTRINKTELKLRKLLTYNPGFKFFSCAEYLQKTYR